MLFISLIFLSQVFLVLHAKSNPDQIPPAAVVGRYFIGEDRYWIVYNKTVQQFRDEGYDVPGDPSWLLQVNYTRLDYTFKSKIVKLLWPNVTVEVMEGKHVLNVTAHRIMEDGSIGEKIASFERVPPHFPYAHTWETWDPEFGAMFNPSVFVVGNTFSGRVLEYSVNRTEILDTPWGQNETYILHGYFANTSHCYDFTIWCDAHSGLILKQIVHSRTPSFISREEIKTVETGIKFEVVHEGEVYEIPIDTNSTIIAFDPAAKKISLRVDGPTGTLGVCNITILKELMPADHNIEVFFDDQKADCQLTEDEDNYYVYVEYQHSAHTIAIIFVTAPIWMQWWFWIIVTVGIMVLAGVVYFLKRRKPSSPNIPPSIPSEETDTSTKNHSIMRLPSFFLYLQNLTSYQQNSWIIERNQTLDVTHREISPVLFD